MPYSYFQNNPAYSQLGGFTSSDISYMISKSEKEVGAYINDGVKILEIGFGAGGFVEFCAFKKVKDYTGIDIDGFFLENLEQKFPDYTFHAIDFQSFLKDKNETYDVIYMSHVFEHLDEKERGDCIGFIFQALKKGGVWINYMPNAESIIEASKHRYFDLTHKTSYCPNSFEQLLNEYECSYSIQHKNSYVGASHVIKRLVFLFFLNLTKIYWIGMGRVFPGVNTWEFISIIKKCER